MIAEQSTASVVAGPEWAASPASVDRLLFVLAQLPGEYRLHFHPPPSLERRAQLVARAYGVEDRLRLHEDAPAGSRALPSTTAVGAVIHEIAGESGHDRESRGDDEIFRGRRIAVVTNRPTHYRVPLWNALADRLARAGADFVVISTSGAPGDRPHMALPPARFEQLRCRAGRVRELDVPLDLELQLARWSPDVIVAPGYSPFTSGRALVYARLRGVTCGLWHGDIPRGARFESRSRRLHRRLAARRASFSMAYSTAAAAYLQSMHDTPTVVVRNSASVVMRQPLAREGDADPLRILAVSRALEGKRLDLLIAAVSRLAPGTAKLTIVGDGPALAALAEQAAAAPDVALLGAVPSDRVQELYAASHVFAFPSEIDVFGLVLVEAFAAGLATVTSPFPGAVEDLAVDGVNCLVVGGARVSDWAAALQRLADDDALRSRIGRAASATIAGRWTIDHSVDAWAAGIRLGCLVAEADA